MIHNSMATRARPERRSVHHSPQLLNQLIYRATTFILPELASAPLDQCRCFRDTQCRRLYGT